jgi:hypothetical protein
MDFGVHCGMPAADYYCKLMGFPGASSFKGPLRLAQGKCSLLG